jgi:H+/Cl- antiporter ClcA
MAICNNLFFYKKGKKMIYYFIIGVVLALAGHFAAEYLDPKYKEFNFKTKIAAFMTNVILWPITITLAVWRKMNGE